MFVKWKCIYDYKIIWIFKKRPIKETKKKYKKFCKNAYIKYFTLTFRFRDTPDRFIISNSYDKPN